MVSSRTLIFYADYHRDYRANKTDTLNNSHIYPTYYVPNLEIVRVNKLRHDSAELTILSNGREPLHIQKGIGNQRLENLIKTASDYDEIQWHIDPDIFTGSPKLPKYFQHRSLVYETSDTKEDPDLYFALIRRTNPHFVGFFELYLILPYLAHQNERDVLNLPNPEPKATTKTIVNLVQQTMPNAKFVLLDSNLRDNLPTLEKDLENMQVIWYNVQMSEPKKQVFLSNGCQNIDFNQLLSQGPTIGFFESHTSALATFKYN